MFCHRCLVVLLHTYVVFLIEVKRIVEPMIPVRDELLTDSRAMRTGSFFIGLHSEGVTWQVKST